MADDVNSTPSSASVGREGAPADVEDDELGVVGGEEEDPAVVAVPPVSFQLAILIAAIGFVVFVCFLLDRVSKSRPAKPVDHSVDDKLKSFVEPLLAKVSPRELVIAGCVLFVLLFYNLWRFRQIRRGLKPVPWILIGSVVLLTLTFTVAATWLMLREAAKASPVNMPQLRFDAIKTGITLFAGTTGAGVLLLSFRAHFTSETDRISSQFDGAAEKLSNESRIVQTVGLLALKRVGLKHRAYRRAAVEVILAYGADYSCRNRPLAQDVLYALGSRQSIAVPVVRPSVGDSVEHYM